MVKERFIGFDLGTQTLGIAISDEMGIVFPRPLFRFKKGNYLAAQNFIRELCRQEKIKHVAIGMPVNMDGTFSQRTSSVMRFIKDLKTSSPDLIISTVDERLTTVEAKERLRAMGLNERQQKDKVDSMAAAIILENFLRKQAL